MQSPAPAMEYPHATVQAGGQLATKQLCRATPVVPVENKLNVSQKCALEVKKDNPILGFISNITDSRSREVMISLYLALVRPDLQYLSSLGSPVQDTDILGESGGGPLI